MPLSIQKVSSPADINHCLNIRHQVFVIGQQVPIHEDVDGLDGVCDHYAVSIGQEYVGAARIRFVDKLAKIERVAILDGNRGLGLGKKLMMVMVDDIRRAGKYTSILLGSQQHAIPFYERLGFTVCSDIYMDAGIPHQDMKIIL